MIDVKRVDVETLASDEFVSSVAATGFVGTIRALSATPRSDRAGACVFAVRIENLALRLLHEGDAWRRLVSSVNASEGN